MVAKPADSSQSAYSSLSNSIQLQKFQHFKIFLKQQIPIFIVIVDILGHSVLWQISKNRILLSCMYYHSIVMVLGERCMVKATYFQKMFFLYAVSLKYFAKSWSTLYQQIKPASPRSYLIYFTERNPETTVDSDGAAVLLV